MAKKRLYGGETAKAVDNFPVSGERVPLPVIHWLGRVKGASARVNGELGLISAAKAKKIARAADEVSAGKHDDQFPIDIFQTGSTRSSPPSPAPTPTTTSTSASPPTTSSPRPSTSPRSTCAPTSCCRRSRSSSAR